MALISTLSTLPPPPPGKTGWPWATETNRVVYGARADWPRISIVTPSFNQAAFIEETIRSVLLQNYPNLQYIVIDGGSTDGTVKILEKYSPWIDYWISEPDRGQSHAINKGLAACNGEWFNWLNSDDYLMPRALAAVARAAQAAPAPLLIAGHLRVLAADGTPQACYTIKLTKCLADDIVNHRTAQPAMYYRRDAVTSINESLHYAMDFDLWVRLLSAHDLTVVHRLAEPLAVFRLHPLSKTVSQESKCEQSKFELEERIILRHLAAAVGSPAAFLKVLAPAAAAGLKPRPMDSGKVNLADLEHQLVRRYLWGDLRRQLETPGSDLPLSLFWSCARVLPTETTILAGKSFIKRWLRRQLRAAAK
jgi:hypothetical protein